MNPQEYQQPEVIRHALARPRVAIVGLSGNELRASNFVGRYLLRHGYDVVPVNPRDVTARGNTASQRVLCKLGFQYRGLREVYGVQGVWYYSLSAGTWARLDRPG